MKIALVTGASRGLGYAIAERLAPQYHVIAVGRTVGALEDLDDAIKAKGGEATLAPMDITTPEAMQHLCRALFDRWGKIDLWVHTAVHAGPLAPAPHLAEKDFDSGLSTNVKAVQRLIGYVAPLLGQTGRAVFFNDPLVQGKPFFGHYATTKAAQEALLRAWQAETLRTGPEVALLTPAPMATALRARFYPGEDRTALAAPAAEAERLLPQILGAKALA